MSRKHGFPIRQPNFAAGIRAQETREGLARTWWAMRWNEIVRGMDIHHRYNAGHRYAVMGQVTSLRMEGPQIRATVVGARPKPYEVCVDFREPDAETHERIRAALTAEPMRIARLLADDLPMEIETVFKEAGFPLFPIGKLPTGGYDMQIRCTCPDYANPCKHVCAVLLILGEVFARRPLALLEARGFTEEELLG